VGKDVLGIPKMPPQIRIGDPVSARPESLAYQNRQNCSRESEQSTKSAS